MSDHDEDRSDLKSMQAAGKEDGPIDLGRDRVSKGDLASTARWLDGRRKEAQADMIRRVEQHSGALRVTNDHLVLTRSDIARLEAEISQGFDTNQRNLTRLHREIRNRRGRIRFLLAALVGFALGLTVPVDDVLIWVMSF